MTTTETGYLIGYNKKDPSFVLFAKADGSRSKSGNLSPLYNTYDWFPILAVRDEPT